MTACGHRQADKWRTIWTCTLDDTHVGLCGDGVIRWEGPRMPEWSPVGVDRVWQVDGPTPEWLAGYLYEDNRASGIDRRLLVLFASRSSPEIRAAHEREWVVVHGDPDGTLEILPDDRIRDRYRRTR